MVTFHGPCVDVACVSAPAALVARIRGEFREMPGLRLTFSQACRLWQMDERTCEAVLNELLREQFLFKTRRGAYIALACGREPLKTAPVQRSIARSA